jgi:hypothetical protein
VCVSARASEGTHPFDERGERLQVAALHIIDASQTRSNGLLRQVTQERTLPCSLPFMHDKRRSDIEHSVTHRAVADKGAGDQRLKDAAA